MDCHINTRTTLVRRSVNVHACTVLPARFSLAEIQVLAGTAGAGRIAPPTSTRISARLKLVQRHVSPVNMVLLL